jgi:hypothetical protein
LTSVIVSPNRIDASRHLNQEKLYMAKPTPGPPIGCAPAQTVPPATLIATPLPLESRPLLVVHANAGQWLPADVAHVRFEVEALSATPEEAARLASVGVQKLVQGLSSVVPQTEISAADVCARTPPSHP